MTSHQLSVFLATWEQESQGVLKLLRALPASQYDFRPDPKGRSIGEMAWHLAEVEGLLANSVAQGRFDFGAKLPILERPKTVAELVPGYEHVHAWSVEKIGKLTPAQLEKKLPWPPHQVDVGDALWGWMLHHLIHHRGQLVLMCRLAGGTPPGLFGPNREEMEAMRAKA